MLQKIENRIICGIHKKKIARKFFIKLKIMTAIFLFVHTKEIQKVKRNRKWLRDAHPVLYINITLETKTNQ